MLPKVSNVESIVLADQPGERVVVDFEKVIYYKSRYYLQVDHDGRKVLLGTSYVEGTTTLHELKCEEYATLKRCLRSDDAYDPFMLGLVHPLRVVGMSYNSINTPTRSMTKFIMANVEHTSLDVLAYVLQTGVDHVLFLDDDAGA